MMVLDVTFIDNKLQAPMHEQAASPSSAAYSYRNDFVRSAEKRGRNGSEVLELQLAETTSLRDQRRRHNTYRFTIQLSGPSTG
jgi:hypothetical protein